MADQAPLYKQDAEGNRYIAEAFEYAIRFENLTGVWTQASGQIQIQADAAFVVLEQSYSFVDVTVPHVNSNVQLIPNIDVLITNTGSGRRLMNQAVKVTTVFGTGQLPFVLPSAQYFSPSSAMQVQISSPANFGAGSHTLELVFVGEKRYYMN